MHSHDDVVPDISGRPVRDGYMLVVSKRGRLVQVPYFLLQTQKFGLLKEPIHTHDRAGG